MGRIKLAERLLGLFVLGWLLLNFPLLSIWDREAFLFGWPLLPLAAFAIWLGLIVALALLMEFGAGKEPADDPQAPPAQLLDD